MVIASKYCKRFLLLSLFIYSISLQALEPDPSTHLRGVVMPEQRIKMSFSRSGIIAELPEPGSIIHKSKIIAKIDKTRTKSELNQSQARFQAAQTELAVAQYKRDNTARLVQKKLLSDTALIEPNFSVEQASANLKASQAQLNIAKKALKECTITAPFDGAVVTLTANVGEWITAGTPFLEFSGLSKLVLYIDIPPEFTSGLKAGLQTHVLDKGRVVGSAAVKTIFPVIDPASGLTRIVWQITAAEGELLSGRYVELAHWNTDNIEED